MSEVNEVFRRLRKGDASAVGDWCAVLYDTILKQAKVVAKNAPGQIKRDHFDDLIQEGRIVALEIAEEVLSGNHGIEDDNLYAYVGKHAHFRMLDYVSDVLAKGDSTPVTTRRRRRRQKGEKQPKHVSVERVAIADPRDDLRAVDAWDAILAACDSDFQRAVIRCLADGHTVKEAAAELGCNRKTVAKARDDVGERVAKSGDYTLAV